MLKLDDPTFLWELYKSAVRRREKALTGLEDEIKRYAGPTYSGNMDGSAEIENPEFEAVAQVGPKVVWDNPRVRCTTIRPGAAQDVTKAVMHGINRNIVVTDMKRVAKSVWLDSAFRYGIFFEELVDQPAYAKSMPPQVSQQFAEGQLPQRPVTRRISPRRYFQDPTATEPREIRFRGHECIGMVSELIERAAAHPEEEWDLDLLLTIDEEQDVSDVYRPEVSGENPPRGEIAYVEMYVDGARIEGQPGPEQGYNGAIVTLWCSGASDNGHDDAKELRPPYMILCPPGGPYTVHGEYPVPDDEVPVSALQAGSAVLAERAAHQIALGRSAARRKKIALGDGLSPEVQDDIRDAEDGDYIVAAGIDKTKVVELELGGISETALAYKQYLDLKADRTLGADDASNGKVTGRATATENSIAFDATNTRTGGRQRTFMDALADHLRIKAWYLYHVDRVAFPVPPEVASQGGMPMGIPQQGPDGLMMTPPDPWFLGGGNDPSSGVTFEDLELTIEPYSMTRTSPEVQASLGMYLGAPFLQELTLVVQNPAVDPEKWIKARADTLNFPTLPEIVDVRLIRLQQGFGLMALMNPPQQDPALAGDRGAQPAGVTSRPPGMLPMGGQPGAFGSAPEKTGTQRIGMAPAGPSGRSSKQNKPAKPAGKGK